MKKLLLSAAALAVFTLWTAPAQAQNVAFKPYVGVDFLRVTTEYNSLDLGGGMALDYGSILDDGLNGLNIHAGNRFHRNFGVELGYFRTRDSDRDIAAGAFIGTGLPAVATPFTTSVQLSGFTLDALGYVPLGAAERFALIGTAGIGWTKAEMSLNVPGVGAVNEDESEFGLRLGAGAEFALTENISVRGLARWQRADFEDTVDDLRTYTVGLNFSF